MAKKLGRGLTELLNNIEDARMKTEPSAVEDGLKIYNIDIDAVNPDPGQPRKYFDSAGQKELEDSIRVHGIIVPLILVKEGDGYVIAAGERRFRAAKAIGMKTVPAIVKEVDERAKREISLIENLQREDLNAMEEAEALKELSENYDLTQEELAVRIGKSRSGVANSIRLLALSDEVKELVRRDRLSAGHARALISVENREAQTEMAYKAADGQLSVRELEQRVKFYLNPPKRMDEAAREKLTLEMKNLIDDMKRIFATKVKAVGNDVKGRIYIDYYSKDDLQRIYELVNKLKKE
jgi:ParB-like partition proteins